MECQSSDSKKLFKVFDASKRKRTRKKREGQDDSNSLATDDSTNGCKINGRRVCSAKASLQNTSTGPVDSSQDPINNREHDSSPSAPRSPVPRRVARSPRRYRRVARDEISLALKAGLVSTPRSISPPRDEDTVIGIVPKDQDSFIYQFLEEAIKRDKKKQRQMRRLEERRASREREVSENREHRHRHRRYREDSSAVVRERDRYSKEQPVVPVLDQAAMFETFAKICAQMNQKASRQKDVDIKRALSHKSLQCEVVSKRDTYKGEQSPIRHSGCEHHRENISPCRIRSQTDYHSPMRIKDRSVSPMVERKENCVCCQYNKEYSYESKSNLAKLRLYEQNCDKYHDYAPDITPTGSCVNHSYVHRSQSRREYKDNGYRKEPTRERYNDSRAKYCEQKTSRSFEVPREFVEDVRKTSRSDPNKDKRYDDHRCRRYGDRNRERYREKPIDVRDPSYLIKARSRRNVEQFDKDSLVSRDFDYRERDKYSEKERDSGLSGADGETSTMSGRSNCIRVVKQEIAEQRDAMDKMMNLWKDLMRCFKGLSQTQGQAKTVQQTENVRESAAAQLRLWRECMRRYETVARDVGDTDARLMEEINKQRSEMAEMASMWQECLQRYRDMSNDFNTLKKQLTPESQTRGPAPPAPHPPLLCAEGEGVVPPASYRLPPAYPPVPPMNMGPGYPCAGSPLRSRASAPPAWWWAADAPHHSPRRRSSPESRGSRERRHRHKERDETRYKEKPSKPTVARSEHRHRKR